MRFVRVWPSALLFVAAMLAACGGDDGGSALMEAADGRLAPPGAEMKWEQEIQGTTTPAHVIRHYTWDAPAVDVRGFYATELEKRGWSAAAGASAEYAEWERHGMIIALVLERADDGGSEWSLALFAPQ